MAKKMTDREKVQKYLKEFGEQKKVQNEDCLVAKKLDVAAWMKATYNDKRPMYFKSKDYVRGAGFMAGTLHSIGARCKGFFELSPGMIGVLVNPVPTPSAKAPAKKGKKAKKAKAKPQSK